MHEEYCVDIDPKGEYWSGGLRCVEYWADKALPLLPGSELTRTRDAIQIDWGGERGIVILCTPEAMELRLPTVEWTRGAYGPAYSSRLWRRIPRGELHEEQLAGLFEKAKRARRREFHTCKYCGRAVPPEHRFSKDVCHGCASEHEGVVY